jgi:hypothetical protein
MRLAIAKIAKEANCVLTVYMDDITLSGDAVPERVVWLVRKQIHARGLHYHKERRFTGHTAEITGAIIKGGKLQIPNRQLKKAYDTRKALEVPARRPSLASDSRRPPNARDNDVRGSIVGRSVAVTSSHGLSRALKRDVRHLAIVDDYQFQRPLLALAPLSGNTFGLAGVGKRPGAEIYRSDD